MDGRADEVDAVCAHGQGSEYRGTGCVPEAHLDAQHRAENQCTVPETIRVLGYTHETNSFDHCDNNTATA